MTETRPLRSYGRRKGKPLSARKGRLIEELLPRLRLDFGKPAPGRLQDLFPVPVKEVWLEIGFGSGEHLLWQAERHKDLGFIGCEPFVNGLATLLGAVESQGLTNIRVHDGDAREALPWLPDRSVARGFILFPDPWPKKRQLKRRLISPATIKELARVLAPGAELRFASDSGDYAAQVLLLMRQNGEFDWLAERVSDWRERRADWPETRYERKALSEGRKPVYLSFRRL
ncbi:MAG TPA: tRNA (guanosine(46)-N7)-methyltransferase TrmB [Rhizobiales bacterium]|jgi:tRNA (guanine-N7-)-methyltransferase|nr:tRNA (guanosine(46)-N7)-methyltransferase TrmB [Hyphomicrobiales bacterium]HAN62677.1 tRNA (guanosine(46)-N7)-methyltransferase TrmB [Hyphomicrobiales bacterium]HBH40768.1 tRNA (guanosine(46)-N7)-methyltransferase TrmB [Hyphomicrobiales bacterium]